MSARIYTTRRLKSASGADIKNASGIYIRVKIHKETRSVSKVKPELWTQAANTAYAQRYPNDIDVKKPRKNKVKTASPAPEVPLLPIEEEEKDDCCICCSELPKATTTLECGHTFCTGCILTWFKRKNNCPMCRAEVKEAPSPTASVGRVHIGSWHANDLINLTNQILNGRNMSLTSSFTHTRVGFEDIHERYRTGMLRRSSRQSGGNGHRFAQALVEVTNRLSANVDDDGYNRYFTSNGNH